MTMPRTVVALLLLQILQFPVAHASSSTQDIIDAFCLSTVGSATALFGFCGREAEQIPAPEPIHVFGVGLSKTGTSSLRDALNDLGFKTYHTSMAATTPGHLNLWHDAAITDNTDAVWDKLAADGFNATTDLPMAGLYRDGLKKYPNAKFILTLRDSHEKWIASCMKNSKLMNMWLEGIFRNMETFRKCKKVFYWARTLVPFLEPGECFLVPTDPEKCIASYDKHNQDVIDTIPPEQLLIFNVKQGYRPLCEFLDIPPHSCPSAFPHSNDSVQVKAGEYLGYFLNNGWVVILLFISYKLSKRVTRRSSWEDYPSKKM